MTRILSQSIIVCNYLEYMQQYLIKNKVIVMDQCERAYEIQRILDQTVVDEKPHYLIKWKGYSSLQATWEPIENLLDALDIVHQWKVAKNPHILNRQKKQASTKTKKINGKERQQRQYKLQMKLNSASQKKRKVKNTNYSISDQQSDSDSNDSNSMRQKKQHETSQFSFGQPQTYQRNTRLRTISKAEQSKNSIHNIITRKVAQQPNNTNCLAYQSTQKYPSHPSDNKTSNIQNSKHQKTPQNKITDDINGFKVVGKVTKQGIQEVVWCFDWQEEKICEVQLKDGRRVNMRRQDVRRICPDKLLRYYEKIQSVRL